MQITKSIKTLRKKKTLTTDNIHGTSSNERVHIKRLFVALVRQFVHQDLRLLDKHIDKRVEDFEVESRGDHFPVRMPFGSCENEKKKIIGLGQSMFICF